MKKIIKLIIFLITIILIISGITFLLLKVKPIANFLDKKLNTSEIKTIDFNSNLHNIEINLGITNLNIFNDTEFKIETNNKKLIVEETNNKIIIKEKESILKSGITDKVLNIYLPSNDYFNSMKISSKAGSISIEDIKLKNTDFSIIAGSITIESIESTKETKIKGGTGEVKIDNGNLKNLEFESGIGETYIKGILKGKSNIQTGIGGFNLDLMDSKEDYQININAVLGEFKIDDALVSKKTTYGQGNNKINIKSGLGDVNISFKN